MGFPLIEHAVVVGDGRRFLGALLTLNEEEARKISESQAVETKGLEDLLAVQAIRQQVDSHVKEVNEKLSRVEQVKKHKILPRTFSIESGELTHILKIKRNVVQQKFAKEIEEMYA